MLNFCPGQRYNCHSIFLVQKCSLYYWNIEILLLLFLILYYITLYYQNIINKCFFQHLFTEMFLCNPKMILLLHQCPTYAVINACFVYWIESLSRLCLRFVFLSVFQVIEVKFDKFDLESDTYCRFDYVAFFNGGEKDDSRRIGKYCGYTAPQSVFIFISFAVI